jgi:HSP20 family protein
MMELMPWRRKSEPREVSIPTRRGDPDMERLLDRLFSDPWLFGNGDIFDAGYWNPPVDITETEKEVLIRSEIPGVDPKNLSITVSGDILVLSGEKSEATERKDENHYRSERRFGTFQRNIQLPATVNPDKVKAEYQNGVLTVRLERKAGGAAKRIPVSLRK